MHFKMSSAICLNLDQSEILSSGNGLNNSTILSLRNEYIYSKSCIYRPLKGSNESGHLQQVVFKCRFYYIE